MAMPKNALAPASKVGVYLGRLVESPDDLQGEVEVIEAVPCKRCNGEEFLGKLSGKLNTPKVKQE